jgi:hypothetical protein
MWMEERHNNWVTISGDWPDEHETGERTQFKKIFPSLAFWAEKIWVSSWLVNKNQCWQKMLRMSNTKSLVFPERDHFPTYFTLRGMSQGLMAWGVASPKETLRNEWAYAMEPPWKPSVGIENSGGLNRLAMVHWLMRPSGGATVGVDGGVISAVILANPALSILAARSSPVGVGEWGGSRKILKTLCENQWWWK